MGISGTLVVEQRKKAIDYLKIIADKFLSYMAFVISTGNGVFQKDNAPNHDMNCAGVVPGT